MHHADAQGLDSVLATIQACAEEDAYFWQPAPLLVRLAAEGGSFASLNED
jgi:3-hydroxyacyl-CoA dehydrogenase